MRAIHRVTGVLFALVTTACVLAAAGEALAGCKQYSGEFTSVLVPPPGCTSPIGVCTLGTLTGGFPSTYQFTMDTLVDANDDPAHPNKVYYTGHSVITDAHGAVLFGSDTGVMFIEPTGTSPFVTTVEIVGGTRQYRHASGEFVATGNLDFITGFADGTYTAAICHGEAK